MGGRPRPEPSPLVQFLNCAKGHWRIPRGRNYQSWGLISLAENALQCLSDLNTCEFARKTAELLEFLSIWLIIKTLWRRERDSNPRYPFRHNGFQDRRYQPLTHPSAPWELSSIVRLKEHSQARFAGIGMGITVLAGQDGLGAIGVV
jgi:hypothetical protein